MQIKLELLIILLLYVTIYASNNEHNILKHRGLLFYLNICIMYNVYTLCLYELAQLRCFGFAAHS